MAEYIDTGDTVEGQKCEIYTRREDCKGLREDPITQKKMLVYELDRNSSVEVRESLILSEEEKILSLLQMPRNRRKSVMDPIMKKLAKFTLFLPARIVLFL